GAAFERARSLAIRRHDLAGELLAVIGQARLVTIRGNQPASEFMLLSVLDRARRPGLGHVRSRALHDLGGLAARRNEFGVAVRLAYEAYGLANEDAERDRILGDIGSFFLDMRILDAARDAHMVVRAQAREQYTRWVSCLNLLDIESQCGYRERFDDLTLFLKRQDLPPELRTGFLFNYGQGLLRFGELAPGGEHLRRALAMASEYGLNRYVLEVEELLTSLHQPEAVNAAAPLDCDVAHVAQELGKLRASLSS
ncbi:MAG TPA: hypothetical protein VFT29_12460, partial [Gemmatimonadaceae bacterium]|nr:hypothetical protein [Gemmatimonadaceae bacterium]